MLGLGVGLAIASGRAGLARILLMGIGFAIGIALLLAAVGVVPALDARRNRETARLGQVAPDGESVGSNVTLAWPLGTTFRGSHLLSIAVAGRGRAPVPPGLPRLPATDEAYASPALVRILRTPDGSLLRARVPGKIVGIIQPEGLLYPDELVAYVGAPGFVKQQDDLRQVIASFGTKGQDAAPVDVAGLVVVAVFATAGLVPIGLFVVAATRLSASTRETRLAALRLNGATQSQVRMFAAIEVSIAAILGFVLGLILFSQGKSLAAQIPLLDYRVFPSDLLPSPAAIVALMLLILSFVVLVTMASMRRVMLSPLGIVRHVPPDRSRAVWLMLVGSGFALLGLAALTRNLMVPRWSFILGAGSAFALILLLVGLVGAAPWLSWRLASEVCRREPPPALLIGVRRLQMDPTSAGRVVGGVTLLLALVGIGQTIALTGAARAVPREVRSLQPTAVVATAVRGPSPLHDLESIPGVLSTSVTRYDPSGSVCARPCVAIIDTDGRPETVERIRNALAWFGDAETRDEVASSTASADAERTVGLMSLGISLALLVTAASLFITTIDGVMERRRSLAVLSAMGVPASIIAWSVIVQVGIPLVVGVTLGAWAGLGAAALLLIVIGEPVILPVASTLLTLGFVVAIVLFVTAAAAPWVRVVRSPELLRSE